jgi:hypothetical protein
MHSTSVDTSRITFTTSGPYIVTANMGFAANATGFRWLKLRVNNSFDIGFVCQAAFTGDTNVLSVTGQWNFSIGDYVEAVVYQNSTGPLDSTVFSSAFPTFSAMRQN